MRCPKCEKPWGREIVGNVEGWEPYQCPTCRRAWLVEQKKIEKERIVEAIIAGQRWP